MGFKEKLHFKETLILKTRSPRELKTVCGKVMKLFQLKVLRTESNNDLKPPGNVLPQRNLYAFISGSVYTQMHTDV